MLSRTTTAALAIMAGLYLPYLPTPQGIAAGMLVPLAGLALYCCARRRYHWPVGLGILLTAALGVLYASAVMHSRLAQQWPTELAGRDVVAELEVVSVAERRPGARPQYRFDARLSAGQCVAGTYCPPGRPLLRLNWYGESPPTDGSRGRVRLRVWPPEGRHSPGAFDYQRWLWAAGYAGSGYVRDTALFTGRQKSPGWSTGYRALRAGMVAKLEQELRGLPRAGVMRALLYADRSGLDRDDWQLFARTGTSHLMAISGMHLGILFAWGLFAGKLVGMGVGSGRVAVFVAPLCGWLAAAGYAALAGFALPTQRALLMLSVLVLAISAARHLAPWRGFVLAQLGVLLLDPMACHSASFSLSFGAVAVLIYGLSGRRPAPTWPLLRAQLLLGIGLLPLSLAWGFWVSPVALPANLMVIPILAFWVMPLLFLALLLTPLLPWLGEVAWQGADLGLALMGRVLHVLAQLSPDWQPLDSGLLLIPLVLACAVVLLPRGLPGRGLALGLVALLLLWPSGRPVEGEFDLSVLDVGQGLSVLVRSRDHALLYDVGPDFDSGFNSADSVVLPYLRRQGVAKLDRLVLSHGDRDHIGALQPLLQGIVVEEIYAGEPERTAEKWPGGATLVLESCHRRQHWRWEGVDFAFLSNGNTADGEPRGNNASCILRISTGQRVVLIPGDIERPVEERLLRSENELASDVLLAPHHGSGSSSISRFVAAVAPQQVIFSAAEYNRYGHPDLDVIARYRERGAQCWQTGRHGSLRFTVGPETLSLAEMGRRKHFFWQRELGDLCGNSALGGARPSLHQ